MQVDVAARDHAGSEADGTPSWPRWIVAATAAALALFVVLAVLRLPDPGTGLWALAAITAGSSIVLAACVWWLLSRRALRDGRLVLEWGLGSGLVLGALWMAEIAFNNLAPPSVATAGNRGVVDNATWAVVAVATFAVVASVAVRTRRWRSALRAALWSGIGSGLGAALGGAILLAFFRGSVERDPLMQGEHTLRAPSMAMSTYVTRETMAGVFGHLWVLGVVQALLLGLLAATIVRVLRRERSSQPD